MLQMITNKFRLMALNHQMTDLIQQHNQLIHAAKEHTQAGREVSGVTVEAVEKRLYHFQQNDRASKEAGDLIYRMRDLSTTITQLQN